MTKGMHRTPAGTKRARQLAAQNSPIRTAIYSSTPEQADWNAQVDAKRAAKKLAKKAVKVGD